MGKIDSYSPYHISRCWHWDIIYSHIMKELKYKTIECQVIYNYIDKATDDS